MRLVYGFRDSQAVPEEDGWMVAKCSRFLDERFNTQEVVEAHAKSTAVARFYASRFNRQVRKATQQAGLTHPAVLFVQCFAYTVEGDCLPGEPQHFAAERFLPGAFLKYNSNNGYVDEGVSRHSDTVQALSHFTFEASAGELMVADLQGVAREGEVLLTDPQVLSREAAFGPGDLGPLGTRRCMTAHRCGPTCRLLGLTPVAASTLRRLTKEGAHRTRCGLVDSGTSADWELLSEKSGGSWEQLSDCRLLTAAPSGIVASSQSSTSSWAAL
jgi:hypothetical protein